MKKLVLIIFVIFVSSVVYSQSGWYQVTDSIQNLVMYTIQFTSEGTGYACGCYNGYSPGALYKTTNYGANWQVTQLLYYSGDDISFLDDNTGYLIGGYQNSFIFKTTNGGNNWLLQDSVYGTFKIKFFDYNTGFVAAKYSQIRKTTNGGANWFSQTGVEWGEPNSLCCLDVNTWFVADGGKLNKTTNGGINWRVLDFSSIGFNSYTLSFINNTTGFSSSYNGKIFKTTNSGENWIQISSIINMYPRDLQFINESTGYISGSSDSGGVYKTTNGGYNWVSNKLSPNYLYSINFINANTGYIGDINGRIFKTTNGGTVFISNISSEIPTSFSLGQNYPNPFNPSTKIKFEIPKSSNVKISVYDIRGKEIEVLLNEKLNAGTYQTEWNGTSYSSGVYFYNMITDRYVETKRMILIK